MNLSETKALSGAPRMKIAVVPHQQSDYADLSRFKTFQFDHNKLKIVPNTGRELKIHGNSLVEVSPSKN